MHLLTGNPMQGILLNKLKQFLEDCDLEYDSSICFSAMLMDGDDIAATGSLDGATLKCIAVSPRHQGEDLTGQIMTVLFQEAARSGHRHLMLYTKPHNQHLFSPLGFHPVIRTTDCLLMENQRNGLHTFLSGIERHDDAQPVGCIVAHCNPFTKGHRYLIERAAAECAWVYVFILSEDRGMFSPEQRLNMAISGCQDLKNVSIHPTGPYLVSAATFPTYFIKDKSRTQDIHCELDVRLFAEKIAPALHISRRYVGTEPTCAVTAQYNAHMKALLPQYGIELVEVPRKEADGNPISASRVREMIQNKKTDQLIHLLPQSSLEWIHTIEGGSSCPIPTECKKT